MGLDERLKRLESAAGVDDARDSICKCPDALMLIGTPDAKTCGECGKAIDICTWKSWHVIVPDAEADYFAFGLRRDDTYQSGRGEA